jgi:L-asparagine transporter-like permease
MSFVPRGKYGQWPTTFFLYGPYLVAVGVIAALAIFKLVNDDWSSSGPLQWPLYGLTGLFVVLGASLILGWVLAFIQLEYLFEVSGTLAIVVSIAAAVALMVLGMNPPNDTIHRIVLIAAAGVTTFFAFVLGVSAPFFEVRGQLYPGLDADNSTSLPIVPGTRPLLPISSAPQPKQLPDGSAKDDQRRLTDPPKRLR